MSRTLKLILYVVVFVIMIHIVTDIEVQLLGFDRFETKIVNFLIFMLVILIDLDIPRNDEQEK